MTKTISEQLQALVDNWRRRSKLSADENWLYGEGLSTAADELESILATEPPAVTVRAGWYAKDTNGLVWFCEEPNWAGYGSWYPCDPDSHYINDIDGIITDPWPDKPNGGPECVMEVG